MVFFTLSASAPFVAAILLFAIGFWMLAVRSLGKQFGALVDAQRKTENLELGPLEGSVVVVEKHAVVPG